MQKNIWKDNAKGYIDNVQTGLNFNLHTEFNNNKLGELYLDVRKENGELVDRLRFTSDRTPYTFESAEIQININFFDTIPFNLNFNYVNNFLIFRGLTRFNTSYIINQNEYITFNIDFNITTIEDVVNIEDININIYNLSYFKNNINIRFDDFNYNEVIQWIT